MAGSNKIMKCTFCGHKLIQKYSYFKKPKFETNFSIPKKNYKRFFYQCISCKHFFAIHKINLDNIYKNNYFDKTYKDLDTVLDLTNKILSYPVSKSDNKQRVKKIIYFLRKYFGKMNKKISILDIGSGLGVFPYEMKKKGFNILSQEMDSRYVSHHRKNLKLKSTFGNILSIKKKFNFITLNKVLEHIIDPIQFIMLVKKILKKNGILYIEVPSIAAASSGKFREEFSVEHFHIFSKNSILLLADFANAKIIETKNYVEPSGKFTISAFFLFK